VEVEPEVPARLQGFPTALRQVLLNIIGNAVKFTDEGEVTMRISCQQHGAATCLLRFEVSDTGIGIAADQASWLFEPFVQADCPAGRKQPGVGLGLSICRSLIKLMSDVAELHFVSEPGGGTRFTFDIDFSIDFAPEGSGQSVGEGDDRPMFKALPVLVAEGNRQQREHVAKWLEKAGMCPQESGSVETALQQLRQAQSDERGFSQIIIGVGSRGMDGYALARAIKSDRHLADAPLLMLIPPHDMRAESLQQEIGFEHYLRKPLRQPRLLAALETIVASQTPTAESDSLPKPPCIDAEVSASPGSPLGEILLVEDHPVNREVLTEMLGSMGYVVRGAATGAEALTALEQRVYSLVMLDCQLPDMDGAQVTQEIRRREGSARHTPVVAVTALALKVERERCLAAGMDAYLTKPVTLESLRRVLNDWVVQCADGSGRAAPNGGPLDSDLWRQYTNTQAFDPDFVPKLVNLFQAHAREQLAEMRAASDARNWSDLARLAHGIAGASAQVGATRMGELSRRLVDCAKAGDEDGVSDLLKRLAVEHQRVSAELSALRGTTVRAM
jgi:CheY-like chemotaxis protein